MNKLVIADVVVLENAVIGDIIQTEAYARDNYKGRRMVVECVQSDIEPREDLLLGRLLLKNGEMRADYCLPRRG